MVILPRNEHIFGLTAVSLTLKENSFGSIVPVISNIVKIPDDTIQYI